MVRIAFYQKHWQDVESDLGVGVRRGGRVSLGSKCFIGQTSPGVLAAVSNHHI